MLIYLSIPENSGESVLSPLARVCALTFSVPHSLTDRGLRSLAVGTLACLWLFGLVSGLAEADDPANPASLSDVRDQIKIAGQLFKENKFSESAAIVDGCNGVLLDLIRRGEKKDLPEWEKLHRQLGRAAESLSLQGAELSPIPEWNQILAEVRESNATQKKPEKSPASAKPKAGTALSFSKDIAPWLVESCGRCHVDKASGGFAMATYEELRKGSKAGVVLFPGDPDSSPIVTAIEGGIMPPNGNKVSPERLGLLKDWIRQGAPFDGSDPKGSIKTLSGNTSADKPKEPEKTVEIKESSGKETISFANDIAPLIVGNCNGCHYGGTRNQGGLSLNNFAGLLKGGTTGAIITPGKADESLLVKKLKGMVGARMPAGGRPPLSDTDIQKVSTWIDEGATFDGGSRDSQLDAVIAKSWASQANHAELSTRRQERARARWQIIAPKSTPDEALDNEFHVLSNTGGESAKRLLDLANSAAKTVRKQFKLNPKDPLVKGGITIYAMKSRYDYSELGTMLEKRSLPPDWSGHWKKDVLDQYVAMVYDKSDQKLNESTLVQQLASIWVASHEGVPKWFADGTGRNALATVAGPNDARVQPWMRRYPQVVSDLKNIQPVLKESMNDEDEAVLGFGIVRNMQQKPYKKQYDQILKGLEGGASFDDSFRKAIGPVEAFLMQALGKGK